MLKIPLKLYSNMSYIYYRLLSVFVSISFNCLSLNSILCIVNIPFLLISACRVCCEVLRKHNLHGNRHH